jgi:hypothetical protein
MPRPCRWKALRNDGQVVPSSWAAAFTVPSCSARANARWASARSARNRLGCQPRWLCRDGQTRWVAWYPGQSPELPGLVSELCPHASRSTPTQDGSTVASVASPSSMIRIRVECWWSRPLAAATRQSVACFGCTASHGPDDRALAMPPGGSRLGPLRKPPACQQAWEAAEPLHGPPAPASRLAVESDVSAGTSMAAVTDEAADPLVLMKTSCRSRERPWVGPPPRAAHHWRSPWRSTTAPRRLLPQLTGMVGPVGVALPYPSIGTP